MAICSRCGCEYDEDDINMIHADVSRIPVDMCQDCLDDAYDDGEYGLFYDTCERCGKSFDVMEEKDDYDSSISGGANGIEFDSFDQILCADCALVERENILHEDDDDEEDDDIPEGCAACGGPYPSCKSSCSMFDD